MSAFPAISRPVFNPLNITLQPGGPPARVIVTENWTTPADNILQFPTGIQWSLDAVLQPLAITADSAGFNFAAPVGMPPTEAPAHAVGTNLVTGACGLVLVTVADAALMFALAPVLWNDGGVLAVINALAQFPVSPAGLPGGAIWSNDGVVSVVPGGPGLSNDGGILVVGTTGYPTSPSSLPAGALWSNGGAVSVVPGITPNPQAAPVFFGEVTAASLLTIGGGNLPLSPPALAGQLWNNGGIVSIVAGQGPTAFVPPLYFGFVSAPFLLELGGAGLPTVNPGYLGQLWNNGGVVTISGGPVLWNNGGSLAVIDPSWPSNYAGLVPGFLWSNPANNGIATVVDGATPNPAAPPVYFGQITSADLLALTGTNLPTSNPGSGTGQLWNDGGVIAIA